MYTCAITCTKDAIGITAAFLTRHLYMFIRVNTADAGEVKAGPLYKLQKEEFHDEDDSLRRNRNPGLIYLGPAKQHLRSTTYKIHALTDRKVTR